MEGDSPITRAGILNDTDGHVAVKLSVRLLVPRDMQQRSHHSRDDTSNREDDPVLGGQFDYTPVSKVYHKVERKDMHDDDAPITATIWTRPATSMVSECALLQGRF